MSEAGVMCSPRVLQQLALPGGASAATDSGASAAACWVESAHAPLSAGAIEFAPPTLTTAGAAGAGGWQVKALLADPAGLRLASAIHRRAFLGLAILASYLGLLAGLGLILARALGGSL